MVPRSLRITLRAPTANEVYAGPYVFLDAAMLHWAGSIEGCAYVCNSCCRAATMRAPPVSESEQITSKSIGSRFAEASDGSA